MPGDKKQERRRLEREDRLYYDFGGPPVDGPAYAEWCRKNAAWISRAEADDQKWRAEVVAANVAELDGKSLAFPAVATPTVTLNKSLPVATLIVRPWTRRMKTDYRTMKETKVKTTFGLTCLMSLTVTGLGPHRGRRKRRGVVDAVVMGFRGELSETGVTCDGRMGLPDIATHVRLRLNDPKAEVVVGAAFGWAAIPAEWLPSKLYVEPKERDPFT